VASPASAAGRAHAHGAKPGTVTTSPYLPGTVFAAVQDNRVEFGGGVFTVNPDHSTGPTFDYDAIDTVTDSLGDLFWTNCATGSVNEKPASGSTTTFASGLNCPTGIGLDPFDGDVFVSDFYHIYRYDSNGTNRTQVASDEASGIAFDGSGDLYYGDGGGGVHVMFDPTSANPTDYRLPGVFSGSVNGLTVTADNSLLVSTQGAGVGRLEPGSQTPSYVDSGQFVDGVAIDSSGNVYTGAGANLVEIPGGTGTPSTIYSVGSGDSIAGIGTFPEPSPGARSTPTVALTTTNPKLTVTAGTTANFQVQVGLGATGYVALYDNGSLVGDSATQLDGDGKASFSTTLDQGTQNFTALYLGDGSNGPASSSPVTFTVDPLRTATTVAYTGTSTATEDGVLAVPSNTPAEFTATVTPKTGNGTPTGDVSFYVNNKFVTSEELDDNGVAVADLSLSPGAHKVRALYNADAIYHQSASSQLPVDSFKPFAPRFNLNENQGNPNNAGNAHATIRVTVTGVKDPGISEAPPVPTGVVTADSGFTCTNLKQIGTSLSATSLCSGTVSNGFTFVTASYSGDSDAATSDGLGWYAGASDDAEFEVCGGGCG
jgi:hypothetical protein